MNIINKQAFEAYKSVFTLLLQIRRAQHALKRLTTLKSLTTTLKRDSAEGALYYSLKHRLLWFTNTLYYHLTDLVLLPQTARMRAKMAKALDVDGMVGVHAEFVNRIREQCLLGPKVCFVVITCHSVTLPARCWMLTDAAGANPPNHYHASRPLALLRRRTDTPRCTAARARQRGPVYARHSRSAAAGPWRFFLRF